MWLFGCSPKTEPASNSNTKADINHFREKIAPFFKPMEIREGDWLEAFPEEGQTFEQYLQANPTLPTAERKTIYIQPLGDFSYTQKRVLKLTADYLTAFYQLPVKLNEVTLLNNIPKEFQGKNPLEKHTQIKTSYFIDKILPNSLPDDAAALICFTNYDLYPDDSMNFVFGQASLQSRVGVWSLWRFGNPDKSKSDYDVFLQRTLKIAVHETGHIFTMLHCTKYECLMSGTNHLGETDRRPLDVCPECLAKIAWAMGYQPTERYRRLSRFWKEQGIEQLSKEFTEKEQAITK